MIRAALLILLAFGAPARADAQPAIAVAWVDADRIRVTTDQPCVERVTAWGVERLCGFGELFVWPPEHGSFDAGDFPAPGEVWRAAGAEAVVPAWRGRPVFLPVVGA